MPAGAARRTRAPEAPAQRSSEARTGAAAAVDSQTLEHRILLTATMCLLAFGAVMVYSASSATTLLQGRGNGSALPDQVRRLRRRRAGRDARARARRGRESARASPRRCCRLVRARARGARAARRRERQRRPALDRPGPAAVPALRADEARARAVLARRCSPGARGACTTCASCSTRCSSSWARPACSSSPSRTSARAMVIAFTIARDAGRRRHPAAQARQIAGRRCSAWCSCTRSCGPTRGRG